MCVRRCPGQAILGSACCFGLVFGGATEICVGADQLTPQLAPATTFPSRLCVQRFAIMRKRDRESLWGSCESIGFDITEHADREGNER